MGCSCSGSKKQLSQPKAQLSQTKAQPSQTQAQLSQSKSQQTKQSVVKIQTQPVITKTVFRLDSERSLKLPHLNIENHAIPLNQPILFIPLDQYCCDMDEVIEDVQIQSVVKERRRKSYSPTIIILKGVTKATEKFTVKEKVIDYQKKQLVLSSFEKSKVFKSLNQNEKYGGGLESVLNQAFYCEVQEGQYLYQKGQKASHFFLIDMGDILIEELKETHGPMEWLDESSIIFNQPRIHCAYANMNQETYLWAWNKRLYKQFMRQLNDHYFNETLQIIDNQSLFKPLGEFERGIIARSVSRANYEAGQKIQVEQAMVIVIRGEAMEQNGSKERQLKEGDVFGKSSLIEGGTSRSELTAVGPLEVLIIHRSKLVKVFGTQLDIILLQSNLRRVIMHDQFIKKLQLVEVERLIQEFKIEKYLKGDVILYKDTPFDKMFIVLEGSVNYSNGMKSVCTRGKIIGREVIKEKKFINVLENIQMAEDGVLAIINIVAIQLRIQNKKIVHDIPCFKIDREPFQALQLKDFNIMKILYNRDNTMILLVQNHKDQKYYQIHCFYKKSIIEQNKEEHLHQYTLNLKQIEQPRLPTLYKTFCNQDFIFFLSEHTFYESLDESLMNLGLLNIEACLYYVSQIILILESLHKNQLIHRDINPNNFYLDQRGQLHLLHYYTAKKVSHRTYTIIGTHHYMAPEVFNLRGYDYAADLWSLGICFYEFICGCVPFGADSSSPICIYDSIEQQEVTFPSFITDKKTKNIISRLLSKEPSLRLGGSYAALKAHPFFDPIDWESTITRGYPKPYKPNNIIEILEKENKTKPYEKPKKVDPLVDVVSPHHRYRPQDCNVVDWDREYY